MEKMSTLITTKLSLPPMLQGPIKGQIKLHIPFITLQRNTPNDKVAVKVRWWGENIPTIFKPLSTGRSQNDLKTIARFNVTCSLDMILSYLKDMNQLKLEVLEDFGRAMRRLGFVNVNLDSVNFGRPLAGLYPVKLNDDVIGEMFVSLSLENFKTDPEKENQVVSFHDDNLKVTSLRKDTNDVLNQILNKAKDLRSSLQATNGTSFNDSKLTFSETQYSVAQLLLEKNNSAIRKLQHLSNISEDSLPDDSVLNSIFYSNLNNHGVSLKNIPTVTVDTQTVNFTSEISKCVCVDYVPRINIVQSDCEPTKTSEIQDEETSVKVLRENILTEHPSSFTKLVDDLKEYSYLKVTVDSLYIGTSFESITWIYSVELQIPWVGRDSAISWNNKGHRKYSDFSVFHMLSDKVKDGVVVFKQDRILPYYYCSTQAMMQLEKCISFIVEARDTRTKMKHNLGSTVIKLEDVVRNNMQLSTDLILQADTTKTLKVEVEFLKIIKKITAPVELAKSKRSDLLVKSIPLLTRKHEPTKKGKINKPVEVENIAKINHDAQSQIQPELNNVHEIGNIALCIYRAYKLPIIYDSLRNTYYPPSTYITLNTSNAIISTTIIKKSTQPIWNFTTKALLENENFLVFKVYLVQGDTPGILFFKGIMKSRNKLFLIDSSCLNTPLNFEKDKILGFASVDLRPLRQDGDHICGSFLINNEVGEDCGELKIFIWPLSKNSNLSRHLCCEEKLQKFKKDISYEKISESIKSSCGDENSVKLEPKKLKVNDFLRKSVKNK